MSASMLWLQVSAGMFAHPPCSGTQNVSPLCSQLSPRLCLWGREAGAEAQRSREDREREKQTDRQGERHTQRDRECTSPLGDSERNTPSLGSSVPRPTPPPLLSLSLCLVAPATLQAAAEQGHLQWVAVNVLGCDSARQGAGGGVSVSEGAALERPGSQEGV